MPIKEYAQRRTYVAKRVLSVRRRYASSVEAAVWRATYNVQAKP